MGEMKKNLLVVANVTAASEELCDALVGIAGGGPTSFTLLVPATQASGGREAAHEKVEEAVARLREAGLEAGGSVGPGDPLTAVSEAWDPRVYDEIVVCTLPMRLSKWLHAGLPERIYKLTGVPVHHVVAEPPGPHPDGAPAPHHERAPLGPLSVLGWGARHDEPGPAPGRHH